MSGKIQLRGLSPELTERAAWLCADMGLSVASDADVIVEAVAADCLEVREEEGRILLTYGNLHELFRGLSLLPGFLENRVPVSQSFRSSMLCYMADMSRNAVYNIPTAKQMIRYLALMGYDSLMLYTEDTYEIKEYPYFGHMRGRFSAEELKELDDYAYGFGIELIPCIQTLAHLATALRWPGFEAYTDIDDILLVGDDRTYRLIDAMLAQCARCFRSRRINIGMDEAHHIGCGKYLKQNGYRKPSEIMCEHLGRVVELCRNHGFAPMIWSDMFFRMAFGTYYVTSGSISQEVIDAVPEGLTLIYWDYYSRNRNIVSHMLECHRQFRNPIAFAGGAWKWCGFASHNAFSLVSSELQLDVCDEFDVDNIIVTGWGDDGGEASQFSVLPTLLFFAERSYLPANEVTEEELDSRSRACFGIGFDDLCAFDLPNLLPGCRPEECSSPRNPGKYLLYNDVLEGFLDLHLDPATAPGAYREYGERLMKLAGHPTLGYAYETLGRLCTLLSRKCDMGLRLRRAYKENDREALAAIARELESLIGETGEFLAAFRRQWYRENKTFGFSAEEQRIGGLCERMRSAVLRINAYLSGEIASIEELEQPVLPIRPIAEGASPYILFNHWNRSVAAGLL